MSLTTYEDSLWNSKVANKSWAELREDSNKEFARLSYSGSRRLQRPNTAHMSSTLNTVGIHVKTEPRKSIPSRNHHSRISDRMKQSKMSNFTAKIINEELGDMTNSPILVSTKLEINNDLIIKSKLVNVMEKPILAFPKLNLHESVSFKDNTQELQSPSICYANMLKSFPLIGVNTIHGINSSTMENPRKEIKKEISKNIYRDDTSMTSYSDIFHLGSPCKSEEDESRTLSVLTSSSGSDSDLATQKEERDIKVAVRKVTQFATLQDKDTHMHDTTLMPNPHKFLSDDFIIASPCKLARTVTVSPKQESEDTRCGKRTPTSKSRERDEAILARRQKQIDYGKNTIGYQRYRQQVPVNKHDRRDPKTPPKYVKYSRRAWDGLVKCWRRSLHFWDPPSEDDSDPETLKLESEVETSSQKHLQHTAVGIPGQLCIEEDIDDTGCQQFV